jgi:hypothetical protein
MFRRVVAALVLTVAGTAPAAAQSPPAPRVWTQIEGTIVSVEATRLTLKTDLGSRLQVDISSMSTADRNALVRGRRSSLIGYTEGRSGEFVAWFVPAAPEEPVAQASPSTTPPAKTAPIPLPSR